MINNLIITNKDLDYIKGLEVYWQETDPDEEDSYYEMFMTIGEKYTDEQIQSAINATLEEVDDDDEEYFLLNLIINLADIDWEGLFSYTMYMEITDSEGNIVFKDDVDFT